MLLLVQYTLIFASVLLLVALGGCFAEHSGVINLGLEGIMVMGALGGALMMRFAPAGISSFGMIVLVLLSAVGFGLVYSSLLAVAAINFKADQTIVGTALNMLGTAAATVIVKAINTAANPDDVSSTIQYVNQKKAFIVNIGSFQFNWFMVIALIALAVMIFGQWKPQRIALAALLFGLFRALSNVYTGFAFLTALNVPSTVYNMMPYIVSLLVLAFTSKTSRAPKAEGIPYDKSTR